MSIYDINGNIVYPYDATGHLLSEAYDINGNRLYNIEPIPLKVMTYNVGQWYNGSTVRVPTSKKADYYAIHNGAFSTYEPDLLFLQEALSTWCDDDSLTADLLSPYFDNTESTRPTTVYQGHYMCTNGYALSNYMVHNFSKNKGNYPSFETAQITVGDRTINLINTHNDYVASYQQVEVQELLTAIANMEYFILCGDFNINLSTEDKTDEQYIVNVKPFLDAGYNIANCVEDWIPTYFGTSDPTGGKFTDNIITSSNITISDVYADTTKLTDNINDKIDHIPLIAELQIY